MLLHKSVSPPPQKGGGRHSILLVEMRPKTEGQNDCHPPCCVYFYPRTPTSLHFLPISGTRNIISVLVQYLQSSTSVLKLMLWHLDTLLEENVDWKN